MTLTEQIDKLAEFDLSPYPVVSLYLNTQPGPTGRDQHQAFVRTEFKSRSRTYPEGSPERDSLQRDLERIATYLDQELKPSTNGVAVFACSAGELFEAVQLAAPIDQHSLYIGDTPHLYPLARLESQYPRYAAVMADTNSTRILVFAMGELASEQQVTGVKTRKTSQGGWSQARFQRHIENYHLQHAKEVVEALDRTIRHEGIQHIVLVADDVVLPLLKEQMPGHLTDLVVDRLKVESHASVNDVLDASLEAMRKENERSDREKVDAAVSEYRAGGLGVVGPEGTFDALIKGQVDELLISANVASLEPVAAGSAPSIADERVLREPAVETTAAGEAAQADPESVRTADDLVARARQTAARVTFIEDRSLLEEYGGVAALLRFRI